MDWTYDGGVRLTPSDCRAMGLVLSVYQSYLTVVNLDRCLIGDTGYQQLAFGLEACTRLEGSIFSSMT